MTKAVTTCGNTAREALGCELAASAWRVSAAALALPSLLLSGSRAGLLAPFNNQQEHLDVVTEN
jgi:hypothetical protein